MMTFRPFCGNGFPLLSKGVRYACSKKSGRKRGTGGRSSFSGLVVTVFGSSGFLGRYVCNVLGKIGSQLILPYRGDGEDMRRLKLCGDLGQVLFTKFDLRDETSIRKAVRYSNAVVNLIGRDWETGNFSFWNVHVDGARKIAKICRESGISQLVHFSALNACENPVPHTLQNGSQFYRSKFFGEQAVLEEFPDALIFRPADIFGQEDRFLKYYACLPRHQFHWMPLYKKGEVTEKQPVFVSDVAKAVVEALREKLTGTIQAVGPHRYFVSELVDWFHRVMRKAEDWDYARYDMDWDPLFKLRVNYQRYIYDWKHPIFDLHPERVEREAVSDFVDPKVPTLRCLKIPLTNIEDQAPWELRQYYAHSYMDYYDEVEAFCPPPPPKRITPETDDNDSESCKSHRE